MSDASGDEAGPPASQAAQGPLQMLRARADLAAHTFLPPRVISAAAVSPTPHPASVPRYLQQRSLLI